MRGRKWRDHTLSVSSAPLFLHVLVSVVIVSTAEIFACLSDNLRHCLIIIHPSSSASRPCCCSSWWWWWSDFEWRIESSFAYWWHASHRTLLLFSLSSISSSPRFTFLFLYPVVLLLCPCPCCCSSWWWWSHSCVALFLLFSSLLRFITTISLRDSQWWLERCFAHWWHASWQVDSQPSLQTHGYFAFSSSLFRPHLVFLPGFHCQSVLFVRFWIESCFPDWWHASRQADTPPWTFQLFCFLSFSFCFPVCLLLSFCFVFD